jgi:hypothetical protein
MRAATQDMQILRMPYLQLFKRLNFQARRRQRQSESRRGHILFISIDHMGRLLAPSLTHRSRAFPKIGNPLPLNLQVSRKSSSELDRFDIGISSWIRDKVSASLAPPAHPGRWVLQVLGR